MILASQSPRRRELLFQIGWEYTVHPSDVEEVITSTDPARVVQELSAQKARDVACWAEDQGPCLIIGADTVVAHEGKILGKPVDEADACRILEELQGQTHSVFTGVTLINQKKDRDQKTIREMVQFAQETRVEMYPMDHEEIQWYVSTGEPMDKAGAYGIQGLGARFIRSIHGDYNNVVGLPVARIYQEIKAGGWKL